MRLKQKPYGVPDMITLSMRAAPFLSILFAMQRIVNALLPTVSIFITAKFIDTALAVVNGTAPRSDIYAPILWIVLVTVYSRMIGTLMDVAQCRAIILYRRKLKPVMVERVANLSYKHIENTETADLIARVAPTFDTQVREMYMRVLDVLETMLYIAGIVITLFTQVWWVALCLMVASGPIFIVATRAGRKSYDADKAMTKIDRRVNYTSDVLKSRDATDERTIYGYTQRLNALYSEKFHFARKYRLKVSAVNFIKTKMGGVICSLVATLTMLALLGSVTSGALDYGMFIGLVMAVIGLSSRLSWGVNHLVQELSRKREYLKDLATFLALESVPDATDTPRAGVRFREIAFKHVTFAYPGTDKPVLRDVSFVIERGRHYAFVGVNGAGKTTVTKLLTGLYTAYEGEITVDGRDLRTFSQAELKGLTSVVYQDFARYFLTLYENIAIADAHRPEAQKRDAVERAVALVDLTEAVGKLANGLDTPLGKVHEDGVDLSVGEWQRAAMARSVVSPNPLRILDEPTAALDPIHESMVYHQFEQIAQGQTTIFISHRLGSTKLADTIFVLDGGRIAEQGSHTALMAKNGLYADMYNAQAAWYAQTEGQNNG